MEPEPPQTPSDVPTRKGYLTKEPTPGLWPFSRNRRRFFCLAVVTTGNPPVPTNVHLKYYVDETSYENGSEPKGIIPLDQCRETKVIASAQATLEIHNPDNLRKLFAVSEEEAYAWQADIERVLAEVLAPTQPQAAQRCRERADAARLALQHEPERFGIRDPLDFSTGDFVFNPTEATIKEEKTRRTYALSNLRRLPEDPSWPEKILPYWVEELLPDRIVSWRGGTPMQIITLEFDDGTIRLEVPSERVSDWCLALTENITQSERYPNLWAAAVSAETNPQPEYRRRYHQLQNATVEHQKKNHLTAALQRFGARNSLLINSSNLPMPELRVRSQMSGEFVYNQLYCILEELLPDLLLVLHQGCVLCFQPSSAQLCCVLSFEVAIGSNVEVVATPDNCPSPLVMIVVEVTPEVPILRNCGGIPVVPLSFELRARPPDPGQSAPFELADLRHKAAVESLLRRTIGVRAEPELPALTGFGFAPPK